MPLHGLVPTLGEAVLVGVVFLAALVVTGELGKKDLAAIAAVRRKRGAGGNS